jgi:hypothetical protein
MKLAVGLLLALTLAGVAAAESSGSLSQALDRQQQDLRLQQSEMRRQGDAQRQALQQQQEQTLRQQLQMLPLQRPLVCTKAGTAFICQ